MPCEKWQYKLVIKVCLVIDILTARSNDHVIMGESQTLS